MVDELQKHKHYLYILCDENKDQQLNKAVLQFAPDSLILVLCAAGRNILSGIVPLTPAQTETLKLHRGFLYALASKEQSATDKRKLLVQEATKRDFVLPFMIKVILLALEHE